MIEYLAFQEEKKQKEDAKLSQKEKQFQALNESLFAGWSTWDLKEFESHLVFNNFIVIQPTLFLLTTATLHCTTWENNVDKNGYEGWLKLQNH